MIMVYVLLAEQHCCDCHISTGFHYPLIRTHRLILSAFSPYFQQLFDSLQSTDVPDKPMIVGGSYFPIIIFHMKLFVILLNFVIVMEK
ncbi:hypothetical protein DERF_012056 [Dermatophagoides farinae]|uniref:BTB domain-containing protein n=1 Tax=Dermatophagoides farinae TaxID=6954 RepID=A0A922KZP1_DERFA|nr:hypothetical protein DERF_012056 [Dermatophagoides farinae]